MLTLNPSNPNYDDTLGNVKPTNQSEKGLDMKPSENAGKGPDKLLGTTPAYNPPDARTPVDHYMRGGVECIDVMRSVSTPEGFQAHCHLTAFKYLYRYGEKDDPIHEVKKARDYLMWLQESLEAEAAVAKREPMDPADRIQAAINKHTLLKASK